MFDAHAALSAAHVFLPERPALAPTPPGEEHEQPSDDASASSAAAAANLCAMIAMLLDKVTRSVALKHGAHWIMDPAERESIATPLAQIAERELGKFGDSPEDRLMLAVGIYAVPRLLLSITAPAVAKATSTSRSETVEVDGERVA